MTFIDQYDLSGKTYIVTGGTGVLGGEIARALLAQSANVAILGRDIARTQDRANQLINLAGISSVIGVQGDVVNQSSLEEAKKVVLAHFGGIDGLVNAAGGNKPEASTGANRTFFEIGQDAFDSIVDLNLKGTVLPCQVFGRTMAEKGEGVILNVSSLTAIRPLTRNAAYSAAKAAISNFTQWLATYLAQEYSPRIRVNAIAPGFFITEQNKYLLTDQGTGELSIRGKKVIEHTPMGRFGEPEDLVGAALWLLSPASSFVTGVVIPVDGGFCAYTGV